jgi:cysteine desulfurase
MRRRVTPYVLAVILVAAAAIVCVRRTWASRPVIYMDHNGTTPLDPRAAREYVRVAREYFGNPSTACVVGRRANETLERARGDVAAQISCRQTELVFTSGATESNVIILRGFVANARAADRPCWIVTTPIEHPSVSATVDSLDREDGVNVVKIQVDRHGFANVEHLRDILASAPPHCAILACFIWINNEIGTMQDVAALTRACRDSGASVFVHLDATQVIGRYLVSLARMNVDSMAFSAHKFNGPHGVGALYLRSSSAAAISPVITGGKQERGLRGGTENVAGAAAMAVALQVANRRLRSGAANKVAALRDHMADVLSKNIPNLTINSPPERCAFNTLSVCLPCDSRQLIAHLSSAHGVCLAVGSACSKGGASNTLQAIGVPDDALVGSLRISLGFDNTRSECDFVIDCILRYLAAM